MWGFVFIHEGEIVFSLLLSQPVKKKKMQRIGLEGSALGSAVLVLSLRNLVKQSLQLLHCIFLH